MAKYGSRDTPHHQWMQPHVPSLDNAIILKTQYLSEKIVKVYNILKKCFF